MSKLFGFLLEGLHSKNTRTRVDCIEELGCLLEEHGGRKVLHIDPVTGTTFPEKAQW